MTFSHSPFSLSLFLTWPAEAAMEQFKGRSRLPVLAAPRRKDLRLRPDLVACTFSGSVAVHIDVLAPTRFLVLNALDFAVDPASVSFRPSASGDQEVRTQGVELYGEDEILVVEFEEELPSVRGILGISFSGVLNDYTRGIYRRCRFVFTFWGSCNEFLHGRWDEEEHGSHSV